MKQVRRDLSCIMPSVSLQFGKQSMFYGFYFLSCTIVQIEGRKTLQIRNNESKIKNKVTRTFAQEYEDQKSMRIKIAL